MCGLKFAKGYVAPYGTLNLYGTSVRLGRFCLPVWSCPLPFPLNFCLMHGYGVPLQNERTLSKSKMWSCFCVCGYWDFQWQGQSLGMLPMFFLLFFFPQYKSPKLWPTLEISVFENFNWLETLFKFSFHFQNNYLFETSFTYSVLPLQIVVTFTEFIIETIFIRIRRGLYLFHCNYGVYKTSKPYKTFFTVTK